MGIAGPTVVRDGGGAGLSGVGRACVGRRVRAGRTAVGQWATNAAWPRGRPGSTSARERTVTGARNPYSAKDGNNPEAHASVSRRPDAASPAPCSCPVTSVWQGA